MPGQQWIVGQQGLELARIGRVSAATIAVGRCRWYSREDSCEKPSMPMSSSA
jgi:hypothetical protein